MPGIIARKGMNEKKVFDMMFEAIEEHDVEQLRVLLQQSLLRGGREVHARDDDACNSLLHRAVLAFDEDAPEDSLEMVRLLLVAGADPNARDDEGVTPLHWLVISQAGEPRAAAPLFAMQMLLAAGADANAPDKDGWSPLISAAHYGAAYLVPALLLAGADVNAQDAAGNTALTHAVRAACSGRVPHAYDVVQLLRTADTPSLDRLLLREGAERFFSFRVTGDAVGCLRWAEECLSANIGGEADAALLELAPWMGGGTGAIAYSEFECAMSRLCRKLGVELPDEGTACDLAWLYDLRHKSDMDFHMNIWQVLGDERFTELERIYREWEHVPGAHEPALAAELARLRRCLSVQAVCGKIRLMFAV